MNTYLTAWIATDRQLELIDEAAQSRRSRTDRKAKAARTQSRSRRAPGFRRHLAAA